MFDEDEILDAIDDYELLEEWEKSDKNNKSNGSCLAFIVCMGAMIAVPISLFVHFVVVWGNNARVYYDY